MTYSVFIRCSTPVRVDWASLRKGYETVLEAEPRSDLLGRLLCYQGDLEVDPAAQLVEKPVLLKFERGTHFWLTSGASPVTKESVIRHLDGIERFLIRPLGEPIEVWASKLVEGAWQVTFDEHGDNGESFQREVYFALMTYLVRTGDGLACVSDEDTCESVGCFDAAGLEWWCSQRRAKAGWLDHPLLGEGAGL